MKETREKDLKDNLHLQTRRTDQKIKRIEKRSKGRVTERQD